MPHSHCLPFGYQLLHFLGGFEVGWLNILSWSCLFGRQQLDYSSMHSRELDEQSVAAEPPLGVGHSMRAKDEGQ